MANYHNDDARITLFFQKQRTEGDRDVYKLLKQCRIRYNVDVAGEPASYLMPLPENIHVDSAGNITGLPLIEKIEIVEADPYAEFSTIQ